MAINYSLNLGKSDIYLRDRTIRLPLRTADDPPGIIPEIIYMFEWGLNVPARWAWPSRFNDHVVLTSERNVRMGRVELPKCALRLEDRLGGIMVVRRSREGIIKLKECLRKAKECGEVRDYGCYVHTEKRKGWIGPRAESPTFYLVPLYWRGRREEREEEE